MSNTAVPDRNIHLLESVVRTRQTAADRADRAGCTPLAHTHPGSSPARTARAAVRVAAGHTAPVVHTELRILAGKRSDTHMDR